MKKKRSSSDHIMASAGIFFFKIAGQPFSIVASLLVAAYLGPSEKGLAAISQLLPSFVASICGLGVGAALKYKISREDGSFQDLGITSLFLGILHGGVAGAIFLIVVMLGGLGDFSDMVPMWIKLTSASLIPLIILRQILFMGFAGNDDFRTSNILGFSSSVIFAVLSIISVTAFGYGFEGVYFSFVISTAITVLSALGLFTIRCRPVIIINFQFVKFSYDYGLRAWLGAVARRGNVSLDQVLLGALAPASAMGNYSVAVSISKILYLVPLSVSPVLTNIVAKSKGEMSSEKVALIQRALLIVTLISGLFICFSVWVLCPIFLPGYNDIPKLMIILIFGAVFYSSFHVISSYFLGSGQPEKSGYCQVPALIGSLVSYPIFVPQFGALGAALGSTFSYFLMYITITWLFSKKIRPKRSQLWRFKTSDFEWIFKHGISILRKIKR